jgi:very-short-patch-repair endonuclease
MDYIADFFCKKLCMVIEVDGITHYEKETHLKDRDKERELERAGFKVVRFTDEEVLNNIEGVRGALESCVEEREKELGFTSPRSPSERGTVLHDEEQQSFHA